MTDKIGSTKAFISSRQHKYLVECMERFPSLAINTPRTREMKGIVDHKWNQIGTELNKVRNGCAKTGPEWQRYWCTYKFRVRRKYLRIKEGEKTALTPLETRALKILCDDNGDLLDTSSLSNPNSEFSPGSDDDLSQPVPDYSPDHEESMDTTDSDSSGTEAGSQLDREETETGYRDVGSQPMITLDAQEDGLDCDRIPVETVWTKEPSKEEVQVDLLQFHLKRQKETHTVEMAQMKERHKLEMDILQLKKRQTMHEYYRIRMMASDTMASERPTDNYLSLTPMVRLQVDERARVHVDESSEDNSNDNDKTKEEIQVEILRFHLKRQKEMHALETTQMKERHALEMEILDLKKKKAMHEVERIKMATT